MRPETRQNWRFDEASTVHKRCIDACLGGDSISAWNNREDRCHYEIPIHYLTNMLICSSIIILDISEGRRSDNKMTDEADHLILHPLSHLSHSPKHVHGLSCRSGRRRVNHTTSTSTSTTSGAKIVKSFKESARCKLLGSFVWVHPKWEPSRRKCQRCAWALCHCIEIIPRLSRRSFLGTYF